MDNKKWYKRFASIFWWVLTILPLLLAVIYYVGYHLTFNSGITTANDLSSYHTMGMNFVSYFNNDFHFTMASYIPPFIRNFIRDLFVDLMGADNNYASVIAYIFGWGVWVQFIHLLFDFIVWLPRWMHDILEKGVGKID